MSSPYRKDLNAQLGWCRHSGFVHTLPCQNCGGSQKLLVLEPTYHSECVECGQRFAHPSADQREPPIVERCVVFPYGSPVYRNGRLVKPHPASPEAKSASRLPPKAKGASRLPVIPPSETSAPSEDTKALLWLALIALTTIVFTLWQS